MDDLNDTVADAVDTMEAAAPRPNRPLPANFKKELDAARKERQPEVFLWNMTIRFLAGEQNLDFDWERRTFVSTNTRPGRNQIVEDQLRPIWNALANVLSVDYPAVAVSPAAPVYDDITKALASEQLGRYFWNQNQMPYVYRDLVEWMLACGTGGLHTYWNDEDSKLVTEAVKAFDMLAEAGSTCDAEATWRACRKTYKRSVLMAIPGYKKYRDVIANAPAAQRDTTEGARRVPLPGDLVDLWDVYFDDGRKGVFCNDTWMYSGTFAKGEKPLIFVRYNHIPGRFWGQSVMVLLLDLQRQLNHVNNLILDLMDANSNLIWLVPFSSGVNCRNLNNAPDGVVGYVGGGGAPQRLEPPPIPSHLFEVRRQIIQAMMDVAGIHSTTLGKRAVGITSKVAIEAMVNQDTSQLQGTMDEIERATHDLFVTILSMYKRKLTGPLAIKMLDKGLGRVIYKELEATMLVDTPELEIGVGSLFRTELQDRNEQIMEMLDKKMIEAPEARKMLTLHLGNQDAMKKMVAYHHAQELLAAAKAGAPIEVFPFDDSDAIKDVFQEYIQSPDYYAEAVSLKNQYDETGDMSLAAAHDEAVRRMNYLRDILVSVTLPPDATPDQIARAANTMLFPRTNPEPEVAKPLALASASPQAAVQSLQGSAELAQRKAVIQAVDAPADAQSAGIAGGVGG